MRVRTPTARLIAILGALLAVSAPRSLGAQDALPAAAEVLARDIVVQDIVQAERDRYDRMTVPVTINGSGPFRFLVDTGAQATVLTARVTNALGLVPTGRATLVAMASRTAVDTIALDGLEFAGRRFNNLTTPLLRDRDIGADGIIGLDSLQELRVIIDSAPTRSPSATRSWPRVRGTRSLCGRAAGSGR